MPDDTLNNVPIFFFSLTAADVVRTVEEWGWARFRGLQILQWVYERGVVDPQQMTNLSRRDRDTVAGMFRFASGQAVREQTSEDGTRKLLISWKINDTRDATAETVMIPDGERRTACISSQVGCPAGCRFCASGVGGLKGNLTADQIVEQVYQLNLRIGERQERISNIVLMGMGEPLANYANVMRAIRILHDPKCFNIGARRITLSTVGVPARMRQLAGEDLPINLAISLHAPNEALRRELIPWAEHFPLEEILDAARFYFEKTGREVTLEYILLSGVNDRPEHARQLAKLCKTLRANVNLIRYNEVDGLPFMRPKADDVVTFQDVLRRNGVNAHVRKSRGRDIDAACGQLRRKQAAEVSSSAVALDVIPGS